MIIDTLGFSAGNEAPQVDSEYDDCRHEPPRRNLIAEFPACLRLSLDSNG